MTKRHVERIVREWQSTLGLDSWRIKINWDVAADEGDFAKIKVSDSYENAELRLEAGFREWDSQTANETIVHELLHIFENQAGCIVESLEKIMEPNAYYLLENHYTQMVENWIDRLAIILVGLAGCV